MSRIREIWKKLKYWQRLGIIFGAFHVFISLISLLLIALNLHLDGIFLYMMIEIPTIHIVTKTINFFVAKELSFVYFFAVHYLFGYLVGTIIYTLIGALLGFTVDKLIILIRGKKK